MIANAFDDWWNSSKYTQVVNAGLAARQAAADGFAAGAAQLVAVLKELDAARAAAFLEGIRAGKVEAQLLQVQEERKFDARIMELALQRMTSMVTTGEWVAPEVVTENLTARIASARKVYTKEGTAHDADEVRGSAV